jgi:vacuolar-type H+-ATPase subunit F/Vma7
LDATGKIAVLAEEDVASLFLLSGVKDSFVIKDEEEARRLLLELSRKEDYKLIIVTNRIAERLEETIAELSMRQVFPLIVAIPERRGPTARRVEPLRRLIRRAVGFDIRIR